MALSDLLMISAVLIAPLVAIQVSVFLEHRREKRQRQLVVFRTLMTTRASRLAPDHVHALNMIDIEFGDADKNSRAVRDAWKAYVDLLYNKELPPELWASKGEDLFIELLQTMATRLGYDFDNTHLRRNGYYPRGYGEAEIDQLAIRAGVRELLEGKRALPVRIPEASDSAQEPHALPTAKDLSQPQLPPAEEIVEGNPDEDE